MEKESKLDSQAKKRKRKQEVPEANAIGENKKTLETPPKRTRTHQSYNQDILNKTLVRIFHYCPSAGNEMKQVIFDNHSEYPFTGAAYDTLIKKYLPKLISDGFIRMSSKKEGKKPHKVIIIEDKGVKEAQKLIAHQHDISDISNAQHSTNAQNPSSSYKMQFSFIADIGTKTNSSVFDYQPDSPINSVSFTSKSTPANLEDKKAVNSSEDALENPPRSPSHID